MSTPKPETTKPATIMLTVHPGRTEAGDMFVFIKWNSETRNLSIQGVENPKVNRDSDRCGQIYDTLSEITKYEFGWDADASDKLSKIWERWHLNDTMAGTPEQTEWIIANIHPDKRDYDHCCAELTRVGLNPGSGGYEYGTKWLRHEVPSDVIEWLLSLPNGAVRPSLRLPTA